MDAIFYWRWRITNIKTEFESESIYNKKFLKIKIKSHGNEATDFHDNDIPILIDFILKKVDKYYLQVLLKKDKLTEKKVIRHITENLELSSHDSAKSDE